MSDVLIIHRRAFLFGPAWRSPCDRDRNLLMVNPVNLQDGEPEIVAKRLAKLLGALPSA